MLNSLYLYYFSPTGGTKKAAEILCKELSENITCVDLGSLEVDKARADGLSVIAMPVFGGRIPAIAAERLRSVNGAGIKAVTVAVYGNRAYEDALRELNDIAEGCGFQVIASAAVIAQHSVVPEVGRGRPDPEDAASIAAFAHSVLEKIENAQFTAVTVPGNTPYKDSMAVPAAPLSGPDCGLCGACAEACPTGAIRMTGAGVETEGSSCILCMACVAACPRSARVLPSPLQERMNQMLAPYADVRRDNEYYL